VRRCTRGDRECHARHDRRGVSPSHPNLLRSRGHAAQLDDEL
jgi:hypothetical protein